MLTEDAEEILESLWMETEENKNKVDIKLFKNNAAFKGLVDRGYISTNPGKILTKKGKEEAKQCVRRHRLAERLFSDVINLKPGLVHEAGCRFEHLLHKGLEDNICILLGHPKKCPHGRTIPEGKCCRQAKKTTEKIVMPLSELKKNKKSRIAYIHTENSSILKKIMAMGILPGSSVVLHHKFPSYVLEMGESRFAIDKEIAQNIYVRVSG